MNTERRFLVKRKINIPTLWIIIIFLSNILCAQEKITLQTGITYQVELQGGKPPKVTDDSFHITLIEPTIIRYSKPSDYNFSWHFEFSARNDKFKCLIIESLAGDSNKHICDIDPPSEKLSGGEKYPWTRVKANIMPEFSHPKTWKSFRNDDIFWMGFKLTLLPVDGKNEPVVRQQWVKMFKREKRKWLDQKQSYLDAIPKHRQIYKLSLPDGTNFTPSTWDGLVEFRDDDFIKIYTISPILLNAKNQQGTLALSWTIDAIIKRNGTHQVTIQNPHNSKECQTSSLRGNTPIQLRIFPQDNYPMMWSWLRENGDSWIPFLIKIQAEGEKNAREWIEWVLISDTSKKRIFKIVDPSQ